MQRTRDATKASSTIEVSAVDGAAQGGGFGSRLDFVGGPGPAR